MLALRTLSPPAFPLALLVALLLVSATVSGAAAVPINKETDIARLCQYLEDQDATVRTQAAARLGDLQDSRATLPLLQLLQNPDIKTRLLAIEALARIPDIRVQQPLLLLLHDKEYSIRLAAISALGMNGDVGASAALIDILRDDPDETLRQHAVYALRQLADARAVEPLIEALHDPALKVWYYAGEALVSLGDHRAAAPLVELVRRGGFSNNPEDSVRLARLFTSADIPLLRSLLESKNQRIQLKGATVLSRLGDEAALNLLLDELREDSEYASFAISALEGLTDPRMVQPLTIDALEAATGHLLRERGRGSVASRPTGASPRGTDPPGAARPRRPRPPRADRGHPRGRAGVPALSLATSAAAGLRHRARGYPIGSGRIESACKLVVQQRCKGLGMRWEHAQAKAASFT